MRIQHLPQERVPRSKLHKGAYRVAVRFVHSKCRPTFVWGSKLTLFSVSLFPIWNIYSIMAPKYKKSSTPSTMTALRVAPQQRAHLHVDISLGLLAFSLRSCLFNQRDPARARARSIPHSSLDPTHNKRWHLAPTSRRYPLAACCPPRFVPCHVVTFILYPNARTRLPLSMCI